MATGNEMSVLDSLFYDGYEYKEMVEMLKIHYGIEMSLSTIYLSCF